jgi:D-alanyl-D-alanine endopeptidase (penicillin-binding protein 7)
MSRKFFDFILSGSVAFLVVAGLVFMTAILLSIVPSTSHFSPLVRGRLPSSTRAVLRIVPPAPLPEATTTTYPGTFSAASVYVVDDSSSEPLFSYHATSTRPLASLTKLMTTLILSELSLPWDTTTTITAEDSDGTSTHLKVGETYDVRTLWHVALVGSSNTAISALVRVSGVPTSSFVALMNAKAKRLRMPSLHFVEPTGLDSHNVGSAVDIARLLRFALKNDLITDALSRPSITIYPPYEKGRIVWSTNWLLTRWIPHNFSTNVVGKTGYIQDAGYNFAARLSDRSQHHIRVVVLGATAPEGRFIEARDVGAWVFKTVRWPDTVSALEPTSTRVSLPVFEGSSTPE